MEQEKPQLTDEQLKQAMENYKQQKAMEQEQQKESEFKVWQLNIFKARSTFWQRIFEAQLFTRSYDGDNAPKDLEVTEAAIKAAAHADAALELWDDRFVPKPPQEPETEGSDVVQ